LEEAVALQPVPDKLIHLAIAYAAARRMPEAKESIRKAQAAGAKPDSLHPLEQSAYRRLLAGLAGT
jgi:hypothetical protein